MKLRAVNQTLTEQNNGLLIQNQDSVAQNKILQESCYGEKGLLKLRPYIMYWCMYLFMCVRPFLFFDLLYPSLSPDRLTA